MDYGLVSIIMPNYNSEKYVEATIKSVLSQTYENWELLFVDDCSTDSSLKKVKAFEDSRIKIFENARNSGAAVSRNYALKRAQGRWIAFLDSDDIWYPEKLERQLVFMQSNNIVFSYTDYDIIDDNDNKVFTFVPCLEKCGYKDILKHNHIGCLTALYDAEQIGVIEMPTNAIKREDLACWLDILKKGIYAHCLHENLAQYRKHTNSVSANKLKMIKYQWRVYRKVEKINIAKSIYYLLVWGWNGFFKYR